MNGGGESIAKSWGELLETCAEHFKVRFKSINKPGNSYPQIASDLVRLIARKQKSSVEEAEAELKQIIADRTSLYPESKARKKYNGYFGILNPKWIITTNYDTVIESILTGVGHSLSPENQLLAPAGKIPVYHLHGIRTNPSSIVITQEDYVALFRPNQYRQQRLPLTIKESVTLLIGYGLGDFNVLTALDWSKNVFKQSTSYQHEMIQLVYSETPNPTPYQRDGIHILEFDDLSKCMQEICVYVGRRKIEATKEAKRLKRIEKKYADPSEEMIDSFLANANARKKLLRRLKDSKHYYINGYLELLSRALDRVWMKARETNQFHEYNNYLCILLEITENIDFDSSPPALIQTISYGLDRVGYYVGPSRGEANAAYKTWLKRGPKLPTNTLKELANITKLNPKYHYLGVLLDKLKEASKS
jgi:hypothetical protein